MVIEERDAARAIGWAQDLVDAGTAEEYALGATTLEDVYIKLAGHAPADSLTEGS